MSGADAGTGLPGGPNRPPTAPDRRRRPAGRVDRRRRRWMAGLSAACAQTSGTDFQTEPDKTMAAAHEFNW